jgi:hypothetical protein
MNKEEYFYKKGYSEGLIKGQELAMNILEQISSNNVTPKITDREFESATESHSSFNPCNI